MLIRSATRLTRPAGAVELDTTHPLCPASGGVWLPDGGDAYNLLAKTKSAISGSGSDIVDRATPNGPAAYTNGKYFTADMVARSFTRCTLVFSIVPDAAPSTVSGFSDFFTTTQATVNWNHTNGAYFGSFTLLDNGAYPNCQWGTIDAGVPVILAATYDGTTIRVYKNGALVNSTTATNSLAGLTPTPATIMGGPFGTAWAGACDFVLWDDVRAASSDEVKLLSDNLWQMLKPSNRKLYLADGGVPDVIDPVFAGGTTLTAGTKTNSSIALSTSAVATDNIAVTGYEWSSDNGATYPFTSLTNSFTFTALTALSSYNFRVRAYDGAGNRSAHLSLTASTYRAGDTGQNIRDNTGPVGRNPAGILYNDVVLPGDADKWFSFLITTPPADAGSLTIDAQGRFTWVGMSADSFYYQLEVDGANVDAPQLVSLDPTPSNATNRTPNGMIGFWNR